MLCLIPGSLGETYGIHTDDCRTPCHCQQTEGNSLEFVLQCPRQAVQDSSRCGCMWLVVASKVFHRCCCCFLHSSLLLTKCFSSVKPREHGSPNSTALLQEAINLFNLCHPAEDFQDSLLSHIYVILEQMPSAQHICLDRSCYCW